MIPTLETSELVDLLKSVFQPQEDDCSMAFLVDLPDENRPDHDSWAERRLMVCDWHRRLSAARGDLGLDAVDLVFYRNVGRNNADLPAEASIYRGGNLPSKASDLEGKTTPFDQVLSQNQILIAATDLSATAPLKVAARRLGFRAATMPGFRTSMIPALRLDWDEVHRRCMHLKELLDQAETARIRFAVEDEFCELQLDLRHRQATASGGLVRQPGTAGNLPSGETYIVPYEGEVEGDPSRSQGELPLEMEGELLRYRIERNRAVEVFGDGPFAEAERHEIAAEPAYANLAELGCGVLGSYGIPPVGEILLDEKLGLHIAFGRSDHFGGNVGPDDFSSPEKVVHIDRVYLPELQPRIRVAAVDLMMPGPDGPTEHPLMRDGKYV